MNSNQPRSDLFNLVASIAALPLEQQNQVRECDLNWVTGKPFPPPTDYSHGNLSPDIAIVMCRKPLTLEEQWFISFGTAMPK
jgi:hypothetical protein